MLWVPALIRSSDSKTNYGISDVQAAVFLEDTDGEEAVEVKIWLTFPDHLCSPAQQRGACWDAATQRWYAPSDEIAAALHELLRTPATSTPIADSAPADSATHCGVGTTASRKHI